MGDKIVDRGEASGGAPPPPVNRYYVSPLKNGWVVRDASLANQGIVHVTLRKVDADAYASSANLGKI